MALPQSESSFKVIHFTLRILSLFATLTPAVSTTLSADEVLFSRDVRPILAANCFACHGLDPESREADLRLDDRPSAVSAGAIDDQTPLQGTLIQRVLTEDADQQMPPPDSGHQLSAEEIAILQRWIRNGAAYQQHWSFRPPVSPIAPAVSQTDWCSGPLDRFVLARLESKGWSPSPTADRTTLIRRLSLDLTGLPPSDEEVKRYLHDPSPDAYDRLVDRLLHSDAFGEHWARMWLDLARYADTKGYEKDRHRDIWRYRDWVIDAFGRDLPFDQFTRDQLAGDLVPSRTDEQLIATAFHRNTMTNEEGGTDDEEFRVAAVKDRVDTTIQVWMGLTMGCAKCHSHKYDPISIDDYYSFYAFFNQTQDNDREAPLHPSPSSSQQRQLMALQQEIKQQKDKLAARPKGHAQAFQSWKEKGGFRSLWIPVTLSRFRSENDVRLIQDDRGRLIASGDRPEIDTWTVEVTLPENIDQSPLTSLRLEVYPKDAASNWPDENVVVNRLTVAVIDEAENEQPVKLKNPRATFSQKGWDVKGAIDTNDQSGWALSPQFKKRQAAMFEFAEPVMGQRLRITLQQTYGQSLLLARFGISVSRIPSQLLGADFDQTLESVYSSMSYPHLNSARIHLTKTESKLSALRSSFARTPVLLELPENQRRANRIQQRGNFLAPGDEVGTAVPEQFSAFPQNATQDRLGVSDWLMQEQNPLTARVMANRVWARLFGVGLVETEEDFGTQGALPTHPQLLDWLAMEYRDHDWSMKSLLRTIVTSSTYRQQATPSPEQIDADPRNRWFARGPRFRLAAEVVRDQALAVSGLLSQRIGGPSVMPPQPPGVWKTTYSGETWKNATGADRYRRGVYTYLKRTSPYPAMITFDAGSGEVCQIRRVRTNTPLQALITLNDTVYLEAAAALARRMNAGGHSLEEKIRIGFQQVLVRHPSDRELSRLVQLYREMQSEIDSPAEVLSAGGMNGDDASMVMVASVLLNLDETLTKP